MDAKYHVEITSPSTAEVDDIPLTPPEEDKNTRRLIRPKIINNANEAAASVQVTLMHQKRHKNSEPWEDTDAFKQTTMKAGDEVRFVLGATETWRLKEALNQLYAIGANGVPSQSVDFVAVPSHTIENSLILKGAPRELLEQLQEQHGEDLWKALDELKSGLLESVALKKINDKRRRVVEIYRKALNDGKGSEAKWQKFFADNLWIFGHGLDFRILDLLEEQPHYGGTMMSGKGAQRGDYLMKTQAGIGFTVIVDIKTPTAELVEEKLYRNKVHQIGQEVAGGVAQLQSYCRTWATDGSRQEENAQKLAQEEVCTYEPKAILIIGNLKQLDTPAKRASFEMFRRNLHNPEILTFDELLARAEFIVNTAEVPNDVADLKH